MVNSADLARSYMRIVYNSGMPVLSMMISRMLGPSSPRPYLSLLGVDSFLVRNAQMSSVVKKLNLVRSYLFCSTPHKLASYTIRWLNLVVVLIARHSWCILRHR